MNGSGIHFRLLRGGAVSRRASKRLRSQRASMPNFESVVAGGVPARTAAMVVVDPRNVRVVAVSTAGREAVAKVVRLRVRCTCARQKGS